MCRRLPLIAIVSLLSLAVLPIQAGPPEELHELGAALSGQPSGADFAPPPGGWTAAIAPVAAFLELDEPQVSSLVELLVQRRLSAAPLVAGIAERSRALAALLSTPQPDPAAIGRLMLEIRQLRGSIHAVQAGFLDAFAGLLDPDQLERYRAVRLASSLQPLLPAFAALGLS